MPESISVEAGSVTRIVVDRPQAMNALTPGTVDELAAAVDAASDEARVLVLSGAGDRAFVAGGDLSVIQDFSPAEAREFTERGHELCNAIESFPAPVIAAIDGYALGAGLELALACDLRVASERSTFAEPEVDLGVIPGFGGTQRLPRHVGDEAARRLLFTGDRIDAREAHELGLVGEVVALSSFQNRVDELASELADKPRSAIRAVKAALNDRFEGSLEDGLAAERERFADLFGTQEQREGMAAVMEDGNPDFR